MQVSLDLFGCCIAQHLGDYILQLLPQPVQSKIEWCAHKAKILTLRLNDILSSALMWCYIEASLHVLLHGKLWQGVVKLW